MSAWLPLACEGLQFKTFHDEFLLLRREPGSGTTPLPTIGRQLLAQQLPFVDEVIATEIEICIRLNQHFGETTLLGLAEQLTQSIEQVQQIASPRVWRLPVCFYEVDEVGQANNRAVANDWPTVTQQSKLSREAVMERLLRAELSLAMFGFLPGFAYISGLPVELHIPRKEVPALYTSPGAVALGGKYLGIYALPSPAGWHVIGTLGVSLLQFNSLPPIAIAPGDRLQIECIEQSQLLELRSACASLLEYNLKTIVAESGDSSAIPLE